MPVIGEILLRTTWFGCKGQKFCVINGERLFILAPIFVLALQALAPSLLMPDPVVPFFPATIIKMNHSTRDSGGGGGRERGREAQAICQSTQRQCDVRYTFLSSCLIHLFIVLRLSSSSVSALSAGKLPSSSVHQ